MNDALFWHLVEEGYNLKNGSNPYVGLRHVLGALSLNELVDFTLIYLAYRQSLYTPAHLAAAYLINEGALGEDDFAMYTESVVVAQKRCFLDVKECPDKLLDHAVYERVLRLDSFPFAAIPQIVGRERFGDRWNTALEITDARRLLSKIRQIALNGRNGAEIVTRELCRTTVPRLYKELAANCDWHDETANP